MKRKAHEFAEALVGESEATLQILAEDVARQALHQRVVQRLRFPQRLFGLEPLAFLLTLDFLGHFGRGGVAGGRVLG
jgi:hypothetical protein